MEGYEKLLCTGLEANLQSEEERFHTITKMPTGYKLTEAAAHGYDYVRVTVPCRIGGRATPVHVSGHGALFEAVKEKKLFLVSMFAPLNVMCKQGVEDWVSRHNTNTLSYTQFAINANSLMTNHYIKPLVAAANSNKAKVLGWVDGSNLLVEVVNEQPAIQDNS